MADGLTRAPVSALDVSLAGAGIALARGAAGLWLNPASVDNPRLSFSAALSLAMADRSVVRDGPLVNQPLPLASDAHGPLWAPALAVSLPIANRVWLFGGYRIGLSHGSVYPAPSVADHEDGARYLGSVLRLREHRAVFGVAVRLANLRVGAALEVGYASLRYRRSAWAGLSADASQLETSTYDSELSLDVGGVMVAARLGASWRPLSWLALALQVTLPGRRNLEGDVELSAPTRAPNGYAGVDVTGGSARVALNPAPAIDAGVLLRPHARIAVVLGVRWRAASGDGTARDDGELRAELDGARYDLRGGPGALGATPAVLPLALPARASFDVGGGVAVQPLAGFLTVRLGYAYRRGASASGRPDSLVLDLDGHVLAGGVEARLGKLRLALGVSHALLPELESNGAQRTLFNPLDESVTRSIGRGRYDASRTRIVLEVELSL